MSRRKKLLFVTDVFPFPADRGQCVRIQNLLVACGRACDVTFLGPAPEREEHRVEVERQCVRTVYVDPPPSSRRARMALAAETAMTSMGLPRRASLRKYAPFVAALRELPLEAFDVVWAERLHVAALCASCRARTVIDFDDIEHMKIARVMRRQRGAAQIAHSAYRYALYRYRELSWSNKFLAVAVCSEEDRVYLQRRGCRNPITVPNGVNVAGGGWPVSRTRDRNGPLRIVFLGNLSYGPNEDAVDFVAEDVLPGIKATIPDASFDVIGPGASPELLERHSSRVTFRGFVEDLPSALREYDVLVAPLRFGGGTKLKVLDAMANGVPLVTSAVGAEGLSLKHGEHAWFAETAAEFREGILRLKQDPAFADRLAENAYSHVNRNFSWTSIQEHLVEWLNALDP
jgi:glycosyltransferase involved in cell wall biosynthesis